MWDSVIPLKYPSTFTLVHVVKIEIVSVIPQALLRSAVHKTKLRAVASGAIMCVLVLRKQVLKPLTSPAIALPHFVLAVNRPV